MTSRRAARVLAATALALPVLAGLAWLATAGAPPAYLAINAGALVFALALVLVGHLPRQPPVRYALALVLLALFALPLLTGPTVNHVARWIPLGPATIHAGLLTVPLLTVLASRTKEDAAPLLLAALFVALLQPDAASAFALCFASVGLYHVRGDWRVGAVAIIAFFAAIAAALRGELPAQRFVERVLVDAALTSPLVALGLFAASAAGFCLILFAAPMDRAARFTVAGSLFGFAVTAIMSNYPSPLIGFGAAPILGYGLALCEHRTAPH